VLAWLKEVQATLLEQGHVVNSPLVDIFVPKLI
jgi:hypothetical protein